MLIFCRSRLALTALLVAGALTGASSATATSVTTTSFSSWKTTLTGSPSEADFSVVSFTNYNTANGLTLPTIGNSSQGFVFTGPDNGAYQMTGISYNSYTSLAGGSNSGAGLKVAMPGSGVNAFLLSVGSTGGTPLTLMLSDNETFALSNGLFGISISHPISSLLLTTTAGSQAVIDDFWFGSSSLTQDPTNPGGSGSGQGAAPVAEAATSLMMAGGCLLLFGVCRKFRTPTAG
jgi:hypothetical protein